MQYKSLENTNNTIRQLCCYAVLIIMSIISGLDLTQGELHYKTIWIGLGIEAVIITIAVAISSYIVADFFALCLFLALSLISCYEARSPHFLFFAFGAIAFVELEYKKGFAVLLVTRFTMAVVVIVLSITHYFDQNKLELIKGNRVVYGYGLGYTHPNRMSYVLLLIMLLIFCWREGNLRYRDLIAYGFLFCINMLVAFSRTTLFCMLIFFMLILLYRYANKNNVMRKTLYYGSVILMPICCLLSVAFPMIYQTDKKYMPLVKRLNEVLNGRISYAAKAMKTYEFTLFGGLKDYSEINLQFEQNPIDNGYIRFIFAFGIIGMIIMILFTTMTIITLLSRRQYHFVIVCVVISVWSVFENILMAYSFNLIPFFWNEIIVYRKNQYRIRNSSA